MNRHVFQLRSFIAILLLSCSQKPDVLTEAESARVTEEVRTMLNDYQRDVSQDGILAELRYLDSSEAFSWHPPGFDGPIDYDSVAAILRTNDPSYSRINSSWDSLSITPVSKTNASYVAHLTTLMSYNDGHTDTFYLYETGNVIKRENGWKLLSGKTVLKK
jgi:hypothetical protein